MRTPSHSIEPSRPKPMGAPFTSHARASIETPLPLRFSTWVNSMLAPSPVTYLPVVLAAARASHLMTQFVVLFPTSSSLIAIYASSAVAMQSQVLVVEFQMNPTYRYLLTTVVVGSATPRAAKLAPHVIARAVALSRILMVNRWPFPGVPVRVVVKLVIAAAKAVIV